MTEILTTIYECIGDRYEPFHVVDAKVRHDKRIAFLPFQSVDEIDSYESATEEQKNSFISASGTIFLYNTVYENILCLRNTGTYQIFYNDFIQKIGIVNEQIILLYTVLHELVYIRIINNNYYLLLS